MNMKISQNNDIYAWNTNLKEWASTNKVLLLNTALTYKRLENVYSLKVDIPKRYTELINYE